MIIELNPRETQIIVAALVSHLEEVKRDGPAYMTDHTEVEDVMARVLKAGLPDLLNAAFPGTVARPHPTSDEVPR